MLRPASGVQICSHVTWAVGVQLSVVVAALTLPCAVQLLKRLCAAVAAAYVCGVQGELLLSEGHCVQPIQPHLQRKRNGLVNIPGR